MIGIQNILSFSKDVREVCASFEKLSMAPLRSAEGYRQGKLPAQRDRSTVGKKPQARTDAHCPLSTAGNTDRWWRRRGAATISRFHLRTFTSGDLRLSQTLASSLVPNVKVLDVPELTVARRVHDKVLHVRAGGSELEAQVQRSDRQLLGKDALRLFVVLLVLRRAGQRLQRGLAGGVVLFVDEAGVVLAGPARSPRWGSLRLRYRSHGGSTPVSQANWPMSKWRPKIGPSGPSAKYSVEFQYSRLTLMPHSAMEACSTWVACWRWVALVVQ